MQVERIEDKDWNYIKYLHYLEDIGDKELVGYVPEEMNRHIVGSIRGRPIFSKTFRYGLFKRFGWKCASCGVKVCFSRNYKNDFGAELGHIDHIFPFSKGGCNESSNLQILCEGCNIRKGNKVEVVSDAS